MKIPRQPATLPEFKWRCVKCGHEWADNWVLRGADPDPNVNQYRHRCPTCQGVPVVVEVKSK